MKKGLDVVLVALFAALICAGCFIHFPLAGGVPIAVQDMLAMLSGLILGPVLGGAAVLVFLILGVIGLPVFTGKAGLHILVAGPTSGFLIGYFVTAVLGGIILHLALRPNKQYVASRQIITISIVAVIQQIVLYVCGFIGFSLIMKKDFSTTMAAVVLPFIPGIIIKTIVMVSVTKIFRKVVQEL